MARRPTIIDVARLAGVSKATAARVLSGSEHLVRAETRKRVVEAAAQLGYERNAIAGSLRTDRTQMVALSIPDITNPFWPGVARGVQDVLEKQGYATVTVNTDWNPEREQEYLRLVRRNRFDGLIINPAAVSNAELRTLRIPVVILGMGMTYPDFDSVGSATEEGVEQSLNYLYDLGHRRIGLMAGHPRRNKAYSRYHSYVAFHARRHLPLLDELVVKTEFTEQAGYEAMMKLLDLEKPPTAVFAANDLLAIGGLRAAHERGVSVPCDLSIMGMDDIYAASITFPPLTTVSKPKYDIGQIAADLLLKRLAGDRDTLPQKIALPCQLVIRGTTAPPRDINE